MTTSVEEIRKQYPALVKFPDDVVRQMYDQMNPKRDLSDLNKGDWVNGAEVLVIKVLGTSSYVGCPFCFTKKEGVEAGISYECTTAKCAGQQRVATRLTKWTLLGSDTTTKVILDFPPFGYKLEDGESLTAKVVSVKGRVQDPRENKDRKTGKVLGTTPVIQVKDLSIVSDIRDAGANSLEAALPKPQTPEQREPIPPIPSPPTPVAKATTAPVEVSADKLNAFTLWMTFRTENGSKPVPEATLKTYVENNLKIPFESFQPYLEGIHTDSQGTVYRLKARATA